MSTGGKEHKYSSLSSQQEGGETGLYVRYTIHVLQGITSSF